MPDEPDLSPRLATAADREHMRSLDRRALETYQLARLNRLLLRLQQGNAFYAAKLAGVQLPLANLAELAQLPFTTKDELLPPADDPQRLAKNLTYSLERYVRYHQTSGTRGRPLAVLDTPEDWAHWIDTWQYVLDAAGITAQDRVLMAFSFGPFIGFWSAFDAVTARGCLVIPGGGMSTAARLAMVTSAQATALFCTPSYALRMAEVAEELGHNLAENSVRVLIVAGEPGGSVPSTRARIEAAWGATVIDHSGATEVGPWGLGDAAGQGLQVIESAFLPEFISRQTGQAAADGELAELVITPLFREGSPVVRYRTGDIVRPRRAESGFVQLEGGVLGRVDDMMIVRGVNVFPSSIEQILRGFPEISEFRLTVRKLGAMDALEIDVEDAAARPERIAEALRIHLGLTVQVNQVPSGTLPRFEAKAARFVDLRSQ